MLRLRVRGSNSLQGMRPWTRGPALRCLRGRSAYVPATPSTIALVGFPADDVDRARRFRQGVLDMSKEDRGAAKGLGWQTHAGRGTELANAITVRSTAW